MENVLTRTESGIYGLVGASGEVVLSGSGRVIRWLNRFWNALAAIANGDGSYFQVLLQGTGAEILIIFFHQRKGAIEFGSG